jgi:hypothetical protein
VAGKRVVTAPVRVVDVRSSRTREIQAGEGY